VTHEEQSDRDGNLKSIQLFFAEKFIGECTYELVAIDIAGQTAALSFQVLLLPCAQTDCSRCNGPKQSD